MGAADVAPHDGRRAAAVDLAVGRFAKGHGGRRHGAAVQRDEQIARRARADVEAAHVGVRGITRASP